MYAAIFSPPEVYARDPSGAWRKVAIPSIVVRVARYFGAL